MRGFTKRERMEAQIAVYGNLVESLMSLMDAAEQLQDGQHLQTVPEDDKLVREQSRIIRQYWTILQPFYLGTTQ